MMKVNIQYIMSMDAHNTFQEVGEDMNGGPPIRRGRATLG